MRNRTVSRLLYAEKVDMGGLPVRQPLPTAAVAQIDPFLLLHHADVKVPTNIRPDHAGVGPHPHRGFSPVTFIFNGGVHHRDSRGNDSTIYAGGAQWMNAGRGIIHSERPPADIHEIGGRQEIVQLWINTPASRKMAQPEYFPVASDRIQELTSEDGLTTLRVFAGELQGVRGPITTASEINAATLHARKGGRISVPLPADHNAMVYLLNGQLTVEGFGLVDRLHLIHLANDGDGFSATATLDTRLLLLSGAPLDEKVVSYGPFVMTTQTEILEAMRDYQMGKMGVLIEA